MADKRKYIDDPAEIIRNLILQYSSEEPRKRMEQFYGDKTSGVINQGVNRLRNVRVKDIPESSSETAYYDPIKNIAFINKREKEGYKGFLGHELSHTTWLGKGNPNAKLQNYTDNLLNQEKSDKLQKENPKQFFDISHAEEIRARLNALRTVRKKKKYWDNWDIDDLKDENINKEAGDHLNDLKLIFDEDKIIKMLNELAYKEKDKLLNNLV
jgi:hypothetical protein